MNKITFIKQNKCNQFTTLCGKEKGICSFYCRKRGIVWKKKIKIQGYNTKNKEPSWAVAKINFRLFYRPHPKDGGRYCFQFISPHLVGGGGTTSQVWPDLGWGTPQTLDWVPPGHGIGYPRAWDRVPPFPWTWDQVPPQTWDRVPPPRHSEQLLLRGGRYASYVHAGGLSCYLIFLPTSMN